MPENGVFITLEGGDGAGKSTQAKMLVRRIRGLGLEVHATFEPGSTNLGRKLRALVTAGGAMDPRSELLIYLADRSQHVAEEIAPALEAGKVVVSDRFADSSEVYQGRARGLGAEQVRRLNRWACGDIWPHLTVVLDIDPGQGLARAASRQADLGLLPDRLEEEGHQFQERVRQGFLDQAAAEPARIKVVPAQGSPEEVAELVWQQVFPLFKE